MSKAGPVVDIQLAAGGRQPSASSFYWAMRLMPRAQREAMYALYNFCRTLDDVADGDFEEREKYNRLVAYRFRIDDIMDGTLPAGQADAFSKTVQAYRLHRKDLMAVIDGMVSDSSGPVRMVDSTALDTYMDQVASAVGRMSNCIFGLKGDDADKLAYHLGRALQLTNILRDLDEDARRDRLYLPVDLLAEYGISAEDPIAALAHPELSSALYRLANTAKAHFAAAATALEGLDRKCTRPARIMMRVYIRLLDKILKRGWHRLGEPVRLNLLEKAAIVFKEIW